MTDPVPIAQAPRLSGAELRQRTLEEGRALGRADWEPHLAAAVTQAMAPLRAAHQDELARKAEIEARHVREARGNGFWRGMTAGSVLMALVLIVTVWSVWKDMQLTLAAASSIERRGGAAVPELVIRDPDEPDVVHQPGGYARGREPEGARR